MPWPPHYDLLLYHIAIQFQLSKKKYAVGKEEDKARELKRIHKEALMRYHPDRMAGVFKGLGMEEQREVEEKLNSITQIVNNDFARLA